MTMNKSLGQKIRELRMKKGITQTELAEGLVTPSMISQIESDKANPSFKLLEGISRKLGVSIDEFLLDMQTELEVDTRHKLAKSLLESKEYAKAITVLEGLLGAPDLNQDEIRSELSDAYTFSGHFDKANRLLEEMLEGIALERDRSKAVMLLRKLGVSKIIQHDYVMAKHYQSQALKELAKAHDLPAEQEAFLYQNYALTLTYLGELNGALEFYKRAITASQGTTNLLLLGQVYMGLANTHARLADFKQAAETTRTAVTMFRSVNNKMHEVQAKANYAIFTYGQGKYDEALTLFQEVLEDAKSIEFMDQVANIYGEMGIVYFRKKDYQEAEKACFQALELLPAQHRERAFVYRTLGQMYQELQNHERALEYLLISVEIFETYGLLSEASRCYANIVSIYQAREELDKASDYMHKMTSSMQEELRARGLYL